MPKCLRTTVKSPEFREGRVMFSRLDLCHGLRRPNCMKNWKESIKKNIFLRTFFCSECLLSKWCYCSLSLSITLNMCVCVCVYLSTACYTFRFFLLSTLIFLNRRSILLVLWSDPRSSKEMPLFLSSYITIMITCLHFKRKLRVLSVNRVFPLDLWNLG